MRNAAITALLLLLAAPAGGAGTAPPRVSVEITGMGLDGYVAYDEPCVLRFRLRGDGATRAATLRFLRVTPPGGGTLFTSQELFPGWQEASLRVALPPAGEARDGEWILPSLRPSWSPEVSFWIVAADDAGRVLGRAKLPAAVQSNPVVILADGEDSAKPLRDAVLSRPTGPGSEYARNEVALLAGRAPALWYEYKPARLVILARPWAGIAEDGREALRRWVSMGGLLAVVPRLSPDWREGGWGGAAADPTGGAAHGAGRVYLVAPQGTEGSDEKALRDWLGATGILLGYGNAAQVVGAEGSPPFTRHYTMPGTPLLLLFIGLIILLVGPLAHLALARMRRRELAWLAIPGLGVLLALAAYGLSSTIKGEGAELEVRRVLRMDGPSGSATVLTWTRMLSSRKVGAALRVDAVQPAPSRGIFSFGDLFGGPRSLLPSILPDRVTVGAVEMQRWSTRDLSFVSIGPAALPLGVSPAGDAAEIVNTSGIPLEDLLVNAGTGWAAGPLRLEQGAGFPAPVKGANDLSPWTGEAAKEAQDGRGDTARGLLAVSSAWNLGEGQPGLVVGARCAPRGMPRVTMTPAPRVAQEGTVCVWLLDLEPAKGGAP